MEGIPGLTEHEQRRVDQSKAIHDKKRQELQAAFSTAAQGGLEQPPSSMAWLEPENIQLLRKWAAHCAHVPACQHGMDFYKSWGLCATFPGIATLGGTCSRPPGSLAGVKNNGQYLSASTAQYPASLAKALAACLAPFCTSLGHHNVSIAHFAQLLPEATVHRRPAVCDGAGLNSTSDHSNPQQEALPGLTDRILTYVRKHNLDNSILCHIAQSKPDRPIAAHHQRQLVHIVHSSLHPDCCNPHCAAITAGQPFRLELVKALAAALKDPDAALRNILREGVPTAIFPLSSQACNGLANKMTCPATRQTTFIFCTAAEIGQAQKTTHRSWLSS